MLSRAVVTEHHNESVNSRERSIDQLSLYGIGSLVAVLLGSRGQYSISENTYIDIRRDRATQAILDSSDCSGVGSSQR